MRDDGKFLVIGWLGVIAVAWAIAMALAMAGDRAGRESLSPWPAAHAAAGERN